MINDSSLHCTTKTTRIIGQHYTCYSLSHDIVTLPKIDNWEHPQQQVNPGLQSAIGWNTLKCTFHMTVCVPKSHHYFRLDWSSLQSLLIYRLLFPMHHRETCDKFNLVNVVSQTQFMSQEVTWGSLPCGVPAGLDTAHLRGGLTLFKLNKLISSEVGEDDVF